MAEYKVRYVEEAGFPAIVVLLRHGVALAETIKHSDGFGPRRAAKRAGGRNG